MALQRPRFWFWWFDLTAWPFAIAKQPYSTGGLPCNWLGCILPVVSERCLWKFSFPNCLWEGWEGKGRLEQKGVSLFEHCLAGFSWTNTNLDKSQRWIGGMAAVPWKHDTSCYKESSFDEVAHLNAAPLHPQEIWGKHYHFSIHNPPCPAPSISSTWCRVMSCSSHRATGHCPQEAITVL